MNYNFKTLQFVFCKLKTPFLNAFILLSINATQAQTNETNINGSFSVFGEIGVFGNLQLGADAQLFFQNGSTLNMLGTATTINSGAEIFGNNTSTLTGTGRILFAGPAAQTLDGGNSSAIGGTHPSLINVAINNTNNVTLINTNARITSGLDFINGHLILANNGLELSSSATATNANGTRHVVTNGTGFMAKEGFSSAFSFPVGRVVSDFTPAVIFPSASDNFFVQVKNYSESASDEFVTTDGVDRTWNIYSTAGTGANIALQHNSATIGPNYTSNGGDVSAFVTQYQGIQWVTSAQRNQGVWQVGTGAQGTNTGGSVSGSVQHNRFYTTTPTTPSANGAFFSKSSNTLTPLPINLLDFAAQKHMESQSLLTWITTSELNSSHFDLETSTDGELWNKIGELQAQGVSLQSSSYQFIHTKPALGINYYRLNMFDRDGNTEISPVRMVEFGRKSSSIKTIIVHPNPTNGNVTVHNTSYSSRYILSDIHGKPIAIFNNIEKNKELSFDLSPYSNGVYYLKEIPAIGDPTVTKIILNK